MSMFEHLNLCCQVWGSNSIIGDQILSLAPEPLGQPGGQSILNIQTFFKLNLLWETSIA